MCQSLYPVPCAELLALQVCGCLPVCRLQAAVSVQDEGVPVTPELTGTAVHMALDAMTAGDWVGRICSRQLRSLLFTSSTNPCVHSAVLPAASLCFLNTQP